MYINASLNNNLSEIKNTLKNSQDLVIQEFKMNGVNGAIVMFDGLVSNLQVTELLLIPLTDINRGKTGNDIFDLLKNEMMNASDKKEVETMEQLYNFSMSGFAVLLIDGCEKGLAFGFQGFSTRGIDSPQIEQTLYGSRESFNESAVTSVALIRRKLKSKNLIVEGVTIGSISNTSVKMLYCSDLVTAEMTEEIKENLQNINLKAVFSASYLSPFLCKNKVSMFSPIGKTERPDTLCSKLCEGRVGIIVDGVPFALILPYLFIDNFQTPDDYVNRPFYTWFIRSLKIISFCVTILLPSIFVAIMTFHHELIPTVLFDDMLFSVAKTPLSPMWESFFILIMYELLREAGLRLPKPIGSAISVVGGLVIGDAAVTAGLVGLPMLIVTGVTAICSFTVTHLYQPVTILRFIFIFFAGLTGFWGLTLGVIAMIINISSIEFMGVAYTAPFSPYNKKFTQDFIFRKSFKKLNNNNFTINNISKD